MHHGLGRGCGAVFGGLLVSSYGSAIAFRTYGVSCVIILVAFAVANYFLQDRGAFSHGGKGGHELLEDPCQLAPQGVPSGIARDLSSSRLKDQEGNKYGTLAGDNKERNNTEVGQYNQTYQGYQGGSQRLLMNEPPAAPTQIYQQQPYNNYDQFYGP
ncbi:hypothetical protein ScPMuIL_005623 [Solemya velum]